MITIRGAMGPPHSIGRALGPRRNLTLVSARLQPRDQNWGSHFAVASSISPVMATMSS